MEYDTILRKSAELMVSEQNGSYTFLQRRLILGYSRAGRIVDQLENLKILGPSLGARERDVLVNLDEIENILTSNNL